MNIETRSDGAKTIYTLKVEGHNVRFTGSATAESRKRAESFFRYLTGVGGIMTGPEASTIGVRSARQSPAAPSVLNQATIILMDGLTANGVDMLHMLETYCDARARLLITQDEVRHPRSSPTETRQRVLALARKLVDPLSAEIRAKLGPASRKAK